MYSVTVILALIFADGNLTNLNASEVQFILDNRARIVAECVKLEVLDEREAKWYLSNSVSLIYDLQSIRTKSKQLHGLPPLSDAQYVPDYEWCGEAIQLNRAYSTYLGQLQLLFGQDSYKSFDLYIQQVLTDKLYQIYDAARDAVHPSYYGSVKRKALARLLELNGGSYQLPPPLPFWFFEELP